jgi:hypothetical protein
LKLTPGLPKFLRKNTLPNPLLQSLKETQQISAVTTDTHENVGLQRQQDWSVKAIKVLKTFLSLIKKQQPLALKAPLINMKHDQCSMSRKIHSQGFKENHCPLQVKTT